jgi:hypothetical protein
MLNITQNCQAAPGVADLCEMLRTMLEQKTPMSDDATAESRTAACEPLHKLYKQQTITGYQA